MLIRKRPLWAIPEREATDESLYLGRRRFLETASAGVVAAALALRARADEKLPAGPYPAKRNETYKLDRPLSDEKVVAKSIIFDEFSTDREKAAELARGMQTTPWKIHIGGQVQKHRTLDVEDLVRTIGLEERLYRHRCVEAWAMAVPWTGFPLRKLVELAEPLAKAKYLRMISFTTPAPGWYESKRVFPYYEALTMAEATHDLAFLATGIYGHPLPGQHGAPIRLVTPWKYGFKSIKSIVAFQFTEELPGTFWSVLSPSRYSFESNVDPRVPKPWPQENETMVGTGEERKTLLYNGYADLVGHLYA